MQTFQSMKIVQVQNHPRYGGGASNLFNTTVDLLERKGLRVIKLDRRSSDLAIGLRGKVHAFSSGIYSPSAKMAMRRIIEKERPDIIHVHDLYPLLVWILPECGKAGVPVVMTCHNYRLTCPTLFHFHHGTVCEKCCGVGRELWCIRNNCRRNVLESVAFALHNALARKYRLFIDNVTVFIAITRFAGSQLEFAGVSPKKIVILPNMVDLADEPTDSSRGAYVSYVGRFSAEKGIEVLLSAAKINPAIPVKLAGDYSAMPELRQLASANTQFVGHLNKDQLYEFFRGSRFIVVPSTWFEVCPLTVLEAMGHGLPVIASRIGSLKEIVEEGVTGLLFEPGNAEDLARKINTLWENSDLCREMGKRARLKTMSENSDQVYYARLMAIYKTAIQMKQS
jgi:glycosyltransferase involved in cell wall biosynthesis